MTFRQFALLTLSGKYTIILFVIEYYFETEENKLKRLTSKIIAVMLVVCMVFPIVPLCAFAGSVSATSVADNVTFKLEKVSETVSSVTVKLVLTEGKTLCFDALLETGESLTCSAIDYSSELNAFVAENTDGALASNNETGKLSFANSVELAAPFDIANFTYSKLDKHGAVLSDFTVSIDSCYYKNDSGQDIQLGTTVINTIPATHTHVASDTWTVETPSDCTKEGTEVRLCTECGEAAESRAILKSDHVTKIDKVDATCTEDGYIRETCLDCRNVVKETILKANGHKFVNDIKKATCTEDGYVRQQCTVCKTYSGIGRVLKATGHAWGAWRVVKEPTYRSVGLRRSTCTNCREFIDEEIPMIVVPVEKIVLSPEEDFTIYCKKTDRLQANVFPEEAAYSAEIVWTSSNPNVVEVGEDGTITAKLRGTATITASTADGSVTATRKVTVEYTFLQWIIIYLLFGWIWYL